MRPNGSLFVHLGPYRSFCVLMGSNGSLYVRMRLYGF